MHTGRESFWHYVKSITVGTALQISILLTVLSPALTGREVQHLQLPVERIEI